MRWLRAVLLTLVLNLQPALMTWKELDSNLLLRPADDPAHQGAGRAPGGGGLNDSADMDIAGGEGSSWLADQDGHAALAAGSLMEEGASVAAGSEDTSFQYDTCDTPSSEALYLNGSRHKKSLKFAHVTETGGDRLENLGCQSGVYWGRYFHDGGWWHQAFRHVPEEVKHKYDWFMVARNPYDRLLDEFYSPWGGAGDAGDEMTPAEFNKFVRFYITHSGYNPSFNMAGDHYTRQHDYLPARGGGRGGGEGPVMHVVRYENMMKEFDDLMVEYNLPMRWSFKPYDWRKYDVSSYDEKTLELIRRTYADDFETFHYSMDPRDAQHYRKMKPLLTDAEKAQRTRKGPLCFKEREVAKVFYINLDKRPDRKVVMDEELGKRFPLGDVKHVRWPGITPTIEFARKAFVVHDPNDSDKKIIGGAGCLQSHIDLMDHINEVGKDDELYLVLEDDHVPVENFKERLREVLKDPDMPCQADYVRLDCRWMPRHGMYKKYPYCSDGENIIKYSCFCGGTHAYIATKEGAAKMANFYREEKGEADCIIANTNKPQYKDLTAICLNYGLTEILEELAEVTDVPKTVQGGGDVGDLDETGNFISLNATVRVAQRPPEAVSKIGSWMTRQFPRGPGLSSWEDFTPARRRVQRSE